MSDVVGTVYTVCVFALDGAGNPCVCLEATLAVSLLVSSSANPATFHVMTPTPVVTAKVYVPANLPGPALLVCPDSTTGVGSLAFCQYSASTQTLGAFGTAEGVASMLGGVRVATSSSSSAVWLGQYNVTVSVSDAANPVTVQVSVPLSQFDLYSGIDAANDPVDSLLRTTVGIAAHEALAGLLSASSAGVVASGNVRFSLLRPLPSALGTSLVIDGSHLVGVPAISAVGNWSVDVVATDLRTALAVTVHGVRLEVVTPRPPNATVSALTRQVLQSGDTAVVPVPGGTFEDPEATSAGEASQLVYAASYAGSSPPPSTPTGSSDSVRVSEAAPLPPWATFDTGSAQLSLQPTLDSVGKHYFLISATSRYGEWSGSASVVQHVTVDYSMRDLLKSLYETFGYVASAFSVAALLFAYRAEVRNVALYGRCMRRGGAPAELLRGEPYELVSENSSASVVDDIGVVRVRLLISADSTGSLLSSCWVPEYVRVGMRQRDCAFAESDAAGGGVRGVSWLRRSVLFNSSASSESSRALLSVDMVRLTELLQRGEVQRDDVFVVEVEAAGWWRSGFILEAFELRPGEIVVAPCNAAPSSSNNNHGVEPLPKAITGVDDEPPHSTTDSKRLLSSQGRRGGGGTSSLLMSTGDDEDGTNSAPLDALSYWSGGGREAGRRSGRRGDRIALNLLGMMDDGRSSAADDVDDSSSDDDDDDNDEVRGFGSGDAPNPLTFLI